MANADAMLRAAKIAGGDESVKVIAVSAGGRVTEDEKPEKKVTDELIDAYSMFLKGVGERRIFSDLCVRLTRLTESLKIKFNVVDELMKIGREEELSSSSDFLISRGEYLYAKIFAALTVRPFVDSATIIRFGSDGKPDIDFSRYLIREKYRETGGFVTGGFYGSDINGNAKLFPRGGGDITGAILALSLGAEEYLNYTDVDGVLSFPPSLGKKIIENGFPHAVKPRPLRRISFAQMEKLCDFSVNVLHPASLTVLKNSGVPIRVKNTFNEYAAGTVVSEADENADDYFFAVDKFGKMRDIISEKRNESKLYDEFLKRAEKVAEEDDEIYYFSECEKSAEIVKNLLDCGRCGTFEPREGGIAAVKACEAEKTMKKIFYPFII